MFKRLFLLYGVAVSATAVASATDYYHAQQVRGIPLKFHAMRKEHYGSYIVFMYGMIPLYHGLTFPVYWHKYLNDLPRLPYD